MYVERCNGLFSITILGPIWPYSAFAMVVYHFQHQQPIEAASSMISMPWNEVIYNEVKGIDSQE